MNRDCISKLQRNLFEISDGFFLDCSILKNCGFGIGSGMFSYGKDLVSKLNFYGLILGIECAYFSYTSIDSTSFGIIGRKHYFSSRFEEECFIYDFCSVVEVSPGLGLKFCRISRQLFQSFHIDGFYFVSMSGKQDWIRF